MTAKEFLKRFESLFEVGSDSLKDAQDNWENSKKFTDDFVKRHIPEIMKEGEGTQTEFEYYRIDIIAYDNSRKEEAIQIAKSLELDEIEFRPYLWDLKIALEHENDKGEWLDEVVKLSHINCPLRVVIGYAKPENEEKCITLASKVLQKKIGNNTPKGQDFLLILGKSGEKANDVSATTYHPYIYRNGKFIKA